MEGFEPRTSETQSISTTTRPQYCSACYEVDMLRHVFCLLVVCVVWSFRLLHSSGYFFHVQLIPVFFLIFIRLRCFASYVCVHVFSEGVLCKAQNRIPVERDL